MAKPPKSGLDYWPRDVGLFQDRKFRKLKTEYGYVALVVYEQLLDMIYSDKGYYLEYNAETKDDVVWDICSVLQGKHQPEPQTIADVIAGLAERGLFDGDCFKNGLITSKRVQETYYRCTVDRKAIEINFDIWLLDTGEMESMSKRSLILSEYINRSNNTVNRSNNPVNQPNYSQSKVKESKVNKSKVNDSNTADKAAVIFKHYESMTGRNVTPTMISDIDSFTAEGAEVDLILAVIDYAVDAGKGNWNYMRGTVNHLLGEGISSLKAYKTKQAERSAMKKNTANSQRSKFNNYDDTNKTDYEKLEAELLEQMLST